MTRDENGLSMACDLSLCSWFNLAEKKFTFKVRRLFYRQTRNFAVVY